MAADTPICPDPSVHDHHNRLSEAASTAALYATKPERNTSALDADGKLSSRSAATSLKHAQAHELPSFPSRGADFSAASTAALLAKDHKVDAYPRPELSAAGSKAALIAHKDGGKVDLWQPGTSSTGNSAAAMAMRNKTLSPALDRGYTDAGKSNSLLAATKVTQQGKQRQRAGSLPDAPPPAYPDSRNSVKNALNAATVSHRASTRKPPQEGWSSDANQAARVKNIHMDSAMFGDHPPVAPEVAEQQQKAALRASAVSMAKQMYDYQKRNEVPDNDASSFHEDMGVAGAGTAHQRNQSSTSEKDLKQEALKYIHLQDAAHKMAQERLAKVDKEMENSRYREYYGYPDQSSPKMSRLSVRGRGRKRAGSEGQRDDNDSDDEKQARRIRSQMTQLSTGIDTVSDKQRTEDRARLLAAAEKRVHNQMSTMDNKVFMETGKPSQAMMDEWEAKAREKAAKDREERDKHPGKTHIGGGKYMDKDEIEAIAAARLKPTFDELDDTAEKKRARDEELRIARDRQETEKMEQKMKEDQTKAEFKRIKEQDKAAARREKEEQDTEKMARKMKEGQTREEFKRIKEHDKAMARKEKEDARREKEERKAAERAEKTRKSMDKRKSREVTAGTGGATAAGAAGGAVAAGTTAPEAADNAKDDQAERQQSQVSSEPKEKTVPSEPKEKTVLSEPKEKTVPSEPKEKTNRRSMFGRFADKLKGPSQEEKPTSEQTKAVGTDADEDKNEDASAVPATAAAGTGAVAAGGTEDEKPSEAEQDAGKKDADGEEEGEASRATAAAAGVVTVGAMATVGALAAAEENRTEEVEKKSKASSLSTEDDSDRERPELKTVASTEHSGHYNFAAASPGTERKPNLERHISAIQDSSDSGDGDESDELEDSDDDVFYGQPATGHLEEPVTPVQTKAEEQAAAREAPVAPAVAPVETSKVDEPPSALSQNPPTPDSPVSPLQSDEEKAVVADKEATPASTSKPESKTATTDKTSSQQDKGEQKERKGVRGFFSKLKSKSKSDGKLRKDRQSTSKTPEKAVEDSAKDSKDGDTKTSGNEYQLPVTIISDRQTEPLSMDPTEGATASDSKRDPGSESPSSFKRHDGELKDLDDVSSSGAEEDDVARGRGGHPGKGEGLFRKYETTEKEEARDQFDESLAPPPAFAGQAKSTSPNRETKFQEEL